MLAVWEQACGGEVQEWEDPPDANPAWKWMAEEHEESHIGVWKCELAEACKVQDNAFFPSIDVREA